MLKEAAFYARMAYYFREYLKAPAAGDATTLIRRHVEQRESNFLKAMDVAVFGNPRTPYSQLFALAGCGPGELRDAVRRHGLEKTLEQLLAAGVYLTNDEAKAAVPVVRHGREIPQEKGAFQNPAETGGLRSGSSGSRSQGVIGNTSTAWRVYRESYEALLRAEFDVGNCSEVSLMPILPAPLGIAYAAAAVRLGGRVDRWFSIGGAWKDSGAYRLATFLMVAEARLMGFPIPVPDYLPQGEFRPVVEYLSQCARRSRPGFVRGSVSAITRICTAVKELGADISGTTFLAGGEALTDGRRQQVESAGARVYSRYIAHEVGPIGMGCRHMTRGNTVHLFTDALAVVIRRRLAALADVEVNSLAFTTLNPSASRVYVNVEMDDSGQLQPADCDCAFSRAGLTTALTGIESFGKLTGFGMTLIGTQILPLLEQKLPQRFGGGAADYQLVERRGSAQMQLSLRVDPRLGLDPAVVKQYFLQEIQALYGGALTRRTWEHAGVLQVEAGRPYATKSGKILPLHLAMFDQGNEK